MEHGKQDKSVGSITEPQGFGSETYALLPEITSKESSGPATKLQGFGSDGYSLLPESACKESFGSTTEP